MLQEINLLTLESRVTPPDGMVYSSNPRKATGEDAGVYFVKEELEVAFAELAGCRLGGAANLHVPEVAVCLFDGRVYSGSKRVEPSFRDFEPWLRHPERVENYGDLYSVIVVDAWLSNIDRNMGNIVAQPMAGRVTAVMIDFEKSKTLRRDPLMNSTVAPARLWPTGDLGTALRRTKPMIPPERAIRRVQELAQEEAAGIVNDVAAKIGGIDWVESSIIALKRRGQRIREIVGEVWQAN